MKKTSHIASGNEWVDACVDQSLSTSSWNKVESNVNKALRQKLEKDLVDPTKRQILFQLLGRDYVKKHFPSYTDNEAILDNLDAKKKAKITQEMKTRLSDIIESAAQFQNKGNKPSKEFRNFHQDTRDIVDADIQLQLKQLKPKKNQRKLEGTGKFLDNLISSGTPLTTIAVSKLKDEASLLTDDLRCTIWTESLSNKEKPKNRGFSNFENLQQKFLQAHSRSRRDSSSDSSRGKVSDSVLKVLKETKCLKSMNSDANIKAVSKILYIYNGYRKSSQTNHVFWTLPLHQVYLKTYKDPSEERYAFASVVLDKILRLCLPNHDQLFAIASKVIKVVEQEDKQLLNHIKENLSKDVPKNSVKDFPSEILLSEKKMSNKSLRTLENSDSSTSKDVKTIVSDPPIFLRKWLHEGFAGILKPVTLLYVWDQLFLHSWSQKSLQDMCLTLLGLLKPWFMFAKNYTEIREVFLGEPANLYTLDVRNAWKHLQRKGDFEKVPDINRNIRYDGKKEEPAVVPAPPLKSPTPVPPPVKASSSFIPWVPYAKDKTRDSLPSKTKVDLPFDFYIDSVRFLPDNATIIKITGKVLNIYLAHKEKSIKLQAYPVLDSFSRNPQFKLKQVINEEKIPVNPDVVIMLRVYTLEAHSKKVVVLGSCLFGPFSNKHGKQALLRVGGHQIRLRHGLPDPDFTVEHMLASHMENNPAIPGTTLLLRVLPHDKQYIPAPKYESGIYRSDPSAPNESEKRLFQHYQDSEDFKKTVRDIAKHLYGKGPVDDETLTKYIKQQLEKEGGDVEDFPYQRFINYCKGMGVNALADKASGLPIFLEGRYLQCLMQYFPGEDTRQGNGKPQVVSFITEDLELNSPQRSPDWSDPPTKLNPTYDDRGFFLVALYGLRPKFNVETGVLFDKDGKDPNFNLQHSIAWSAVPCFDKGAVYSGTHHVPLLKGRPTENLIQKLGYLPLDYICKQFKNELKVFDTASIEITIWDGHFNYDECPPLPTHTNYLNISPNPSKYLRAKDQKFGQTALQLIRDGMSDPNQFSQYQNQIIKLLTKIFRNVMDNALGKEGYQKMVPSPNSN